MAINDSCRRELDSDSGTVDTGQQETKMAADGVECVACGLVILDKYLLQVAGQRWHGQCLRCCQCQRSLDAQSSCFAINGQIYCRDDYFRLFVMKKCAHCGRPIEKDQLATKVTEDIVYHVSCFVCDHCCVHLVQGDYFLLCNKLIRCVQCLDVDQSVGMSGPPVGKPSAKSFKSSKPRRKVRTKCQAQKEETKVTSMATGGKGKQGPRLFAEEENSADCEPATAVTPTPTPGPVNVSRGEERDNNKKAKEEGKEEGERDGRLSGQPPAATHQRVSATDNGNNAATVTLSSLSFYSPSSPAGSPGFLGPTGGHSGPCSPASSSYCQSAGSSPLPGQLLSSSALSSGSFSPQRPKRMRTSFKHHQLRQMKAYFVINHNPDSKELRSLATKTGLSKRVLQVWFQNARAKWRRSVLRQQQVYGPHIVEEGQPLSTLRPEANVHCEQFAGLDFGSPSFFDQEARNSGRQGPQNLSTMSASEPRGGDCLLEQDRDEDEQTVRGLQFFIGSTSRPTVLEGSADRQDLLGQLTAASGPGGPASPMSASVTISHEEQSFSFFNYHLQRQSLVT
ncbi:LIM/homeobox protein Lhx2 [Halotydeus destructor]|nr:LIM/homeobox protein Lhx2 [Halotydeus destructor]